MADDSREKIVIITGGSSGIGWACAVKYQREGYHVINADIAPPIESLPQVYHIKCDISNKEDVKKLSDYVYDKFDHIDTIILAAGQGIHENLAEGDPEKWQQIININLMGNLRVLRAFLPAISKGGDVFIISSVSAIHPYKGGAIYAATKAALDVVAETLRLEEQPDIRVTNILPGVVDTAFFDNMIGGGQTVESIGWGAITPKQVANEVYRINNLDSNISVNKVVIRPSAQPM